MSALYTILNDGDIAALRKATAASAVDKPGYVLPKDLHARFQRAAQARVFYPVDDSFFAGRDRVYLRPVWGQEKSSAQQDVETYLQAKGYYVTDYNNGYASDAKGVQKYRIGKLLDGTDFQDRFRDDATRLRDKKLIVISRDPNDIACLSTGRNWTTCLDLEKETWLPDELVDTVARGMYVAYLIDENDLDIKAPYARVSIKPYWKKSSIRRFLGDKEVQDPAYRKRGLLGALFRSMARRDAQKSRDAVIYQPDMIYGSAPQQFRHIVSSFLDDVVNVGKSGRFEAAPMMLPEDLQSWYIKLRAT